MAGTNQAVNLTGMLSQIGSTLSKGVDISPLTSNIENMSRPELDMNNPDSLERYAKWAESTGKREEAMSYRQQAADLRKQIQTNNRVASAYEDTTAGQMLAQNGDVEGLEYYIKQLQGKMRNEDATPEERRTYMAEIQRLNSMRPGAQKQSVVNKGKGVLKLEEIANDEQFTPQQRANAAKQLEVLKQDPEAASAANDIKVQQFKQEQVMAEMQADEFIKQNTSSIMDAIKSQDPEALSNLVSSAPPAAQGKIQATVNNYINIQRTADDWAEQRAAMSSPLDIDEAMESYADLPEEFLKPIQGMYTRAAKFQENNFHNGQWDNQAALAEAKKLEADAASFAKMMVFNHAQSEAGKESRKQAQTEAQIQRLTLQIEEPIPLTDVVAYANRKFTTYKENGTVKSRPTEKQFEEAEQILRERRNSAIDRQISILRNEEVTEEETQETLGGYSYDYLRAAAKDGLKASQIAQRLGLDEAKVREIIGEEDKAEASYLERVRSRLSPMGTYGGRAPSLTDLVNEGR